MSCYLVVISNASTDVLLLTCFESTTSLVGLHAIVVEVAATSLRTAAIVLLVASKIIATIVPIVAAASKVAASIAIVPRIVIAPAVVATAITTTAAAATTEAVVAPVVVTPAVVAPVVATVVLQCQLTSNKPQIELMAINKFLPSCRHHSGCRSFHRPCFRGFHRHDLPDHRVLRHLPVGHSAWARPSLRPPFCHSADAAFALQK